MKLISPANADSPGDKKQKEFSINCCFPVYKNQMFWPHSTPIKSQVLEVGPKHPHFPNLPDDFTAEPRLRGTILELQGLHVVDVDLPQKLMGPADGTTECWKTELFNPGFMFPLLAQERCWRANIRNRGRGTGRRCRYLSFAG